MEFRRCGGTGKVNVRRCGRVGEVPRPTVAEGFTELTSVVTGETTIFPSDRCGWRSDPASDLKIRPIADAAESLKIRPITDVAESLKIHPIFDAAEEFQKSG